MKQYNRNEIEVALNELKKFLDEAEFEVNPNLENVLTIDTRYIRILFWFASQQLEKL